MEKDMEVCEGAWVTGGNRPVGIAGIKKAKTPALIHWTDTCAGPTVFCAVPEALWAQQESPHPAGV